MMLLGSDRRSWSAGRAGPPTVTVKTIPEENTLAYRAPFRCSILAADRDAHRARGAGDDRLGRLDVTRVQVGHLRLGDLTQLRLRQRRDLDLVRCRRTLLDTRRLLDEFSGGRRLGDEGERAVFVHGDLDRDHVAPLG